MIKKLLIISAFLVAVLAHAINMHNFPYFENDEGTYYAQGYAFAYEGKLSRYTYWYDHAPAGWMLIGTWMRVTGGPFTFGYSLDSGRILMLLTHIISSFCIYKIVTKLTRREWAGALAVVLFSVNPLGVYFQRRLLLDNIMTTWLLVSTAILLYSRRRISWILMAGIVTGIAIVSKETAIFVVPPLALLTLFSVRKSQWIMALITFIMPIVLIIGTYILFAALKSELFPGAGHVSLIETWKYHLSRGNGLPFYNPSSEFMYAFRDWIKKDPIFIVMTLVSMVWVIVRPMRGIKTRIIGLVLLFVWSFFIKGGLIINFYVVPALAFGAITLGVMVVDIARTRIGCVLLAIALIAYGIQFDKRALFGYYAKQNV
jgi:4-amino-4-deoxy-L-arabinose transferase-like glycosyltransferase